MYRSLINKTNFLPLISVRSIHHKTYLGLTGAQAIYNKLNEHKVKHTWLYSGGAIMSLVDCFYNNNHIKYYINTHEQSGGHAATGYAKTTGKPGVLITTSGPGLTNTITAMQDATSDSTPLIVLTGQVPIKAMGTNAFQEVDAVNISKPVTKWSYCVQNVNEIPFIMDKALDIATSGKPGAVHIDLPKCILASQISNIDRKYFNIIKQEQYSNTHNYNHTIYLINNAKRPVFLIGQGCNSASKELRKLIKKTQIPVTTTIHAMGIYDECDPLSLEFVGMHGNVAANYAIQEADLIIALGTRFDDRITGNIEKYAPKAYQAYKKGKGGIIHVNINKDEINTVVNSHYNFNISCKTFISNISRDVLYNPNRKKWLEKISIWKKLYPFKYDKLDYKLNTQTVISEINKQLIDKKIDDYYITSGVGNHQMMASQFIKWRYPNSFISSGSLGVMGVGLPYAIGCQLGNPKSMVIDIDGDGSFNHTLSELKTVREYNLPIKIAILNDSSMSMVKAWEELFFDGRITATDINHNPNYEDLAQSFDIMSSNCDNIYDLEYKVDEFLTYPDSILCEFKVEPDLCLPLVPPGAALDDIITKRKMDKNEDFYLMEAPN